MTVTEQIDQQHQEDLQRLRGFRLLDDDFLTKCFEGDPQSIQLVLRIVLEMPDLEVVDVHTQVFVENLLNRSVRLDVLATDSADRKMNVEIQRADKGAGRKRARYNSSMMDANLLRKGEDFDDGSHILYVNGEYRDETPIGKLMHDFSCTDPADMYYDKLADRVRFFKESKEGVAIMCKVMEDMRTQAALERAKTVVYRMLAAGKYSLEEIADMTEVSLDEVKKMKAASESFNH